MAKRREDVTEFGGLRVVWLEAFVRSVQARSRVAAAAQMGVDPVTITKHIQKLEGWLARGQIRPLMHYQVWPLHLTEEGEEFLPQAVMVLETLRQARIPLILASKADDPAEQSGLSRPNIDQE